VRRLLFVVSREEADPLDVLNTWHALLVTEDRIVADFARTIARAVAKASAEHGENGRRTAGQVLARIGAELMALGRAEEARDHADQAAKLAKRWLVEVAALSGELANRADKPEVAGRLLQEVVTRAPRSPEARQAHLTLGRIELLRGRVDEAVGHFDQVLIGNDDHVLRLAALRAKAETAVAMGRYPDALECLAQAITLAEGTDDESTLALALGELHADRGDLPDAEPWLRDAVSSGKLCQKDHFAALRRLGDVVAQRGNSDAAVEYLNAALTYAVDLDADSVVDAAAAYLDVLYGLGHSSDIDLALRRAHDAVAGGLAKARLLIIEAELRVNEHRFGDAKAAYAKALTLYRLSGDRFGEVRALLGMARAEKPEGTTGARLHEARRLVSGLRGPQADSLRRQVDDLKGW
jgi:tetratricopeptide (TPR) repeat protein